MLARHALTLGLYLWPLITLAAADPSAQTATDNSRGHSTEATLWAPVSPRQPAISIIIDDLGRQLEAGLRAIRLPSAITYSVLPYTPHSIKLAKLANLLDKEVILHLPMQAEHWQRQDHGTLTAQQTKQELQQLLRQNLDIVPHISGVNNHMGSLLTRQPERMQWIMEELRHSGSLYFIDSRTTAHSVGYQQAVAMGIPSLQRDIFLDHDKSVNAINRQFIKLLEIARQQGSAVAIGHPYPTTLTYLENMLPSLALLGIQLLPASEMIRHRNPQTAPVNAPITQLAQEYTSFAPPKIIP